MIFHNIANIKFSSVITSSMCSKVEIIEMANKLFEDYDLNDDSRIDKDELQHLFKTLFYEI